MEKPAPTAPGVHRLALGRGRPLTAAAADTLHGRARRPVRPRVPARVREDWERLTAPTRSPAAFDPAMVDHLPTAARRWLRHAIAPGTPLHRRAVLVQHGQIRLAGRWWPIRAVEALDPLHGYVWPVRTRLLGLPLVGLDRLSGGSAEMTHRLLGAVPLVRAAGPDLARSAAARAASEICWVPAAALAPSIAWRELSDTRVTAKVPVAGETHEVTLDVDDAGVLRGGSTRRWAQVNGGPWQWHDFGARDLGEATFGGFTVPSRVVAGYGERYWSEGAFIRLVVDDILYC